jgi:hypothetical protein
MAPRPADDDYIERIIASAVELGFPSRYIARLEGFRD